MIVDASVALKWLIPEEGSGQALQLLARNDLRAPGLFDQEIAQVLTKKVRQRLLEASTALRLWQDIALAPVERQPWESYGDGAFALSLRLGATFPDCVYLAMAVACDDRMITADARFVRAAERDPGLRRHIVSLP